MSKSQQRRLVVHQAIELADGWSFEQSTRGSRVWVESIDYAYYVEKASLDVLPHVLMDALAAQLVRQLDETIFRFESVEDGRAWVWPPSDATQGSSYDCGAYADRTINTLVAIIDSGVLE